MNGFTFVEFSIFDKGDKLFFFTSCFILWSPAPSEDESTLKGKKEFASKGMSLFRIDPFSKGSQNDFERLASLKCVFLPLKVIR